ncbi:MAG: hypothetical protein EXQ49_10965 [Acidobacteria bacterium]|nr:hypothetical protein [Acidobacteriota bacterium]
MNALVNAATFSYPTSAAISPTPCLNSPSRRPATFIRHFVTYAIAGRGRRFTNAHAPAATCTPSRYALLTGEYAWRKPGTNVLPGDARLIIDPARTTLPSMMKAAGYVTGVVGHVICPRD